MSYHDPFVTRIGPTRKHSSLAGMESMPLTSETPRASDAALIVTVHADVDYRMVVVEALLVVDTRNATVAVSAPEGRVVKV